MDGLTIPELNSVRTVQSDWGTTVSGNYRNLLVKLNNQQLSISGSLQKFNRSQTFLHGFGECKTAIDNLCNTFSFEPSIAKVKRLDIAHNFNTTYEPKMYYQFLGSHWQYFRSPYKNSLNYSNSLRALSFYDKAKEQNIPGNILRYEQRYFKPETTFKKNVSLSDLVNEDVYQFLIKNWRADYQKINKIGTIIPMKNLKNPTQFFDYLIALKTSELGADLLETQIRVAQRSGIITKQNAKRIRDKINRLSRGNFFEINDLVSELDNKILNQSI